MRIKLLCLVAMSGLLALAASADENPAHQHSAPKITAEIDGARIYGELMPTAPDAVPLASVLANPAAHLDGSFKISGRIGKVCQTAGCWMSLIDGEQQLRVVFGDHAFSIPSDTVGQAQVYGTLQQTTLSEAKAKHMAEDAGLDPATVTGEQVEYRLVATSVAVRS
jgi:hypothetical protein